MKHLEKILTVIAVMAVLVILVSELAVGRFRPTNAGAVLGLCVGWIILVICGSAVGVKVTEKMSDGRLKKVITKIIFPFGDRTDLEYFLAMPATGAMVIVLWLDVFTINNWTYEDGYCTVLNGRRVTEYQLINPFTDHLYLVSQEQDVRATLQGVTQDGVVVEAVVRLRLDLSPDKNLWALAPSQGYSKYPNTKAGQEARGKQGGVTRYLTQVFLAVCQETNANQVCNPVGLEVKMARKISETILGLPPWVELPKGKALEIERVYPCLKTTP